MIATYDLMHEDGLAYSICSECDCRIDEMADARWVVGDEGWSPIICADCAEGHAPGCTKPVEPLEEVQAIIDAELEIDSLRDRLREVASTRIKSIRKILGDEGCKEGLLVYQRCRPFIVTGIEVSGIITGHERVYVIMHPTKKDGTASKINEDRLEWTTFIKIWRMQRSDQELYVARCMKKDKEMSGRRRKIITDDQL